MSKRSAARKLAAKSFRRSDCPLACALDVVGDKWTLLILRDLLFGKTRYSEFLGSGEKIPTNILAARLRHLEERGLIYGKPYQERPRRNEYQLTEAGRSLEPVIQALARWGTNVIPGTRRARAEPKSKR
jgi:DNA-binding HxlR family transcriptional regulator